jgi:hypothetical protein
MPDIADGVAREQARVLGGGVHRFPKDNYSHFEMWGADPLFCARVLAGKGSDFIFGKSALELDPMHAVRMLTDGEVLGL